MKIFIYFTYFLVYSQTLLIPQLYTPYNDVNLNQYQQYQPYFNQPNYQPSYMPQQQYGQNFYQPYERQLSEQEIIPQNEQVESISQPKEEVRKLEQEKDNKETDSKTEKKVEQTETNKITKKKKDQKQKRELSLVKLEQTEEPENRETLSLLDNRKRALLWMFSSFLQILKKIQIHDKQQLETQFKSYFTTDYDFFYQNFYKIFMQNYKQHSQQFNYQQIEDDLTLKIMTLNIPQEIKLVQQALEQNNNQQPIQQTGISQEFINNLNLLQKLVSTKEKIMMNPSQSQFIFLSLNDSSIKNQDQFNSRLLQDEASVQAYIKYYRGLKYSQKTVEGDIKVKEGQELLKRIEDSQNGIFYLRYIDVYEEFDTEILNSMQKQDLFNKIEQIKQELSNEDFLFTIFQILQKQTALGNSQFDETYALISKEVFLQYFENLIKQPKYKYLIEFYFEEFLGQFEKLLSIFFGDQYQEMIQFDYRKYLKFLVKQTNQQKFFNINKLFDNIYINTDSIVSSGNNDKQTQEFLKLNLNMLLQVYYPYLLIKDTGMYNQKTKDYKIPQNLNPRDKDSYTQNDQNIINEKSKFINDPQTSEEILEFIDQYLSHLKNPEEIEKFRNSPNYKKIYNILESYFGKDFLESNYDFTDQNNIEDNLPINDTNKSIQAVYKKRIGNEVRIAKLIIQIFSNFDQKELDQVMQSINNFNNDYPNPLPNEQEIENNISKLDDIQNQFENIFDSEQQQTIKRLWMILISNFSQQCYIKLFAKLTKRIGIMKTQNKVSTLQSLNTLLQNFFTFLKTKKPYNFEKECAQETDQINKLITDKDKMSSSKISSIQPTINDQQRKGNQFDEPSFEFESNEEPQNKNIPNKKITKDSDSNIYNDQQRNKNNFNHSDMVFSSEDIDSKNKKIQKKKTNGDDSNIYNDQQRKKNNFNHSDMVFSSEDIDSKNKKRTISKLISKSINLDSEDQVQINKLRTSQEDPFKRQNQKIFSKNENSSTFKRQNQQRFSSSKNSSTFKRQNQKRFSKNENSSTFKRQNQKRFSSNENMSTDDEIINGNFLTVLNKKTNNNKNINIKTHINKKRDNENESFSSEQINIKPILPPEQQIKKTNKKYKHQQKNIDNSFLSLLQNTKFNPFDLSFKQYDSQPQLFESQRNTNKPYDIPSDDWPSSEYSSQQEKNHNQKIQFNKKRFSSQDDDLDNHLFKHINISNNNKNGQHKIFNKLYFSEDISEEKNSKNKRKTHQSSQNSSLNSQNKSKNKNEQDTNLSSHTKNKSKLNSEYDSDLSKNKKNKSKLNSEQDSDLSKNRKNRHNHNSEQDSDLSKNKKNRHNHNSEQDSNLSKHKKNNSKNKTIQSTTLSSLERKKKLNKNKNYISEDDFSIRNKSRKRINNEINEAESEIKNIIKKKNISSLSENEKSKIEKDLEIIEKDKKIIKKLTTEDKPDNKIHPPHIFTQKEKQYLKKLATVLYKSNENTNNGFHKAILYKKSRISPQQKDFISRIIKKYPNTNSIQTLIRESSPMKQKLKKIMYKVVKKRICQREKPKKDCNKECFRIIDGKKYKITEQDPHYVDLCQQREDEEIENEEHMEEFECDQYGNDISLLGKPGKKQVNLDPVFNLNFVFNDERDIEDFKNFADNQKFMNIIELLSKNNVMDVEKLKEHVKDSDPKKIFNINVSPTNRNEDEESISDQSEENDEETNSNSYDEDYRLI